MDLGLKGLKAVVTGGTKGIGRAIAQTLAAEGAHVAFCARNAEEVAQAVKDFSGHGVKISGRAVDVADGPALAAWVNDVAAEFGGIDIVVANVSALAIATDEAAWQRGFEVDMILSNRQFSSTSSLFFGEYMGEIYPTLFISKVPKVNLFSSNRRSSVGPPNSVVMVMVFWLYPT
jgi:NAD(P)-dependent dehydrogenase (short-subunit alcohol dehydrogenase family)